MEPVRKSSRLKLEPVAALNTVESTETNTRRISKSAVTRAKKEKSMSL